MRPAGLALLLLLSGAACVPPEEDEGMEEVVESDDTIPPPPYSEQTQPSVAPPSAGTPGEPVEMELPATKRGVLLLEGKADSTDFRLVETPDGFPVQFTTYVPADMVTDVDSVDGGHSIEFVANFGGVLNQRAYMQVFFYPRRTSLPLARTTVDNFIRGLNPEVDRSVSEAPEPWAYEQTSFSYPHEQQTYVGRIALAKRGEIAFHMLAHYPAEYADGMGPRIAAILQEWRWADGTPLMR
ncbi:MAG: hypothetical protein ACYC28_06275 [Longimicrobiales bacterium]